MRRGILPVLLLSLSAAGAASADPITVTSGGFLLYGPATSDAGSAGFDFSGSGFAASGNGRLSAQSGFEVGVLDLSGSFDMFDVFGSVTVGDQTLRGFESVSLLVTAAPIVINDAPQGTYGGGSAAFTATGVVRLYKPGGPSGPPLITQEINGAGTVSIIGQSIEKGAFRTAFVSLGFAPAASPSPTPEPASLLLVGTGLAAAWQSRRFRRGD